MTGSAALGCGPTGTGGGGTVGRQMTALAPASPALTISTYALNRPFRSRTDATCLECPSSPIPARNLFSIVRNYSPSAG